MKKTFDILYYTQITGVREFSHKTSEPWEKTPLHCPRCGDTEVWFRNDGGDYYVGEQYLCIGCDAEFHLPDGVSDAKDEQNKQRLKNLKSSE